MMMMMSVKSMAAPILISVSVSEHFGGSRIGKVCYTSTNSFVNVLYLLLK